MKKLIHSALLVFLAAASFAIAHGSTTTSLLTADQSTVQENDGDCPEDTF